MVLLSGTIISYVVKCEGCRKCSRNKCLSNVLSLLKLRRERISERIKALQEPVPSCNKTDRAAMLDEILDYVKFLRLQVKVLSMSRLGGASAVAQLVADIPMQSVEGDSGESRSNQHVWDKWSNAETDRLCAFAF